ncbi:MAG: M1 family metallopeptidase [Bacteroidota bacterium]
MQLKLSYFLLLFFAPFFLQAQAADRWQQAIDYKMEIDFDVKKHQYKGNQVIVYTNNSPDTLNRVFYHLYFNAFQPGSQMDMRQYNVDSDRRVGTRISKLGPDELGYQKVSSLMQDGKPTKYETVGTILEVALAEPILPGAKTTLVMKWDAQVPLQIRRSGRMNKEGIDYSMAQWYPKLSEYDYQGWHANPYIGREFHGVWGDFDVKISIDKDYVVGATGYIQNPNDVGHGYSKSKKMPVVKDGKITYHFKAPNVHDFVWGADPDYKHTTRKTKSGVLMRFFYQENKKTKENWEMLPEVMEEVFAYANKNFGQYPYEVYSFIQGGDGGMEYPMATLITGERVFPSLVGVSVHELMHSWYQMVLGTNESLYPWMDEGFTSYASNEIMNHLRKKNKLQGEAVENPQARDFLGFAFFAKSGAEEPLSTHADHYMSNRAYGVGSYTKGSIFMAQLKYIIGEEAFRKGILRYYDTWKFKHPNPNDFIRVMEKESGLELDWYKEYMVNTTHTIDYAVEDYNQSSRTLTLKREGMMPMPIDLLITYQDGTKEMINIPMAIMRGAKPAMKMDNVSYMTAPDWGWTNPLYELQLRKPMASAEIDPNRGMVDVELDNNTFEVRE